MRIRTGLMLCLLVALGVAGCGGDKGGDGVATAGGATSAPPSAAAANEKESVLKYAQCMRENGVPEFPDPEVGDGGESRLSLPDGLDMAKVQAAEKQCRQYMPNGGEPQQMDPKVLEQMRKYSQCMRDNGIPEFPDPSGGGLALDMNELGLSGPDDPKLKAAEEACNDLRPAPPSGAPNEQSRSEG
jgi:hypothetical protein